MNQRDALGRADRGPRRPWGSVRPPEPLLYSGVTPARVSLGDDTHQRGNGVDRLVLDWNSPARSGSRSAIALLARLKGTRSGAEGLPSHGQQATVAGPERIIGALLAAGGGRTARGVRARPSTTGLARRPASAGPMVRPPSARRLACWLAGCASARVGRIEPPG